MTHSWQRIGGWTAACLGWLSLVVVTARYLWLSATLGDEQPRFIHFDWHAYAAGGLQLLDRSLYREPLALGDVPLPLESFNLPPLAAAEALVPLLPLGVTAGGLAWQVVAALGVAVAAFVLGAVATRTVRGALLVAGLALSGYVLVGHLVLRHSLAYWWGLSLGTNNYLVLGLVAGFTWLALGRHERSAGLLLGLAVATKLWPVTLAVVLVRERRWRLLAWAAGACVVQAVGFLAWLGPDVVPDLARALRAEDVEPSGIIGLAALRSVLPWWPTWTGWIVAAALLALPVRGTAGIGTGILAGLAVITNLWGHYLPTLLFAIGLVVVPLLSERRQRTTDSTRSSVRSATTAPATRNGPKGM